MKGDLVKHTIEAVSATRMKQEHAAFALCIAVLTHKGDAAEPLPQELIAAT